MILCNSQEKENKEREYLEMCTSNRVAGIVLCSAGVAVEEFQGSNIPLITIERYMENGTASVECDNKQGGKLAAEHLISCGCKNLLHISGVYETAMPADDRALGFIEVCEKAGVSHREVATNTYQYNNLEYHDFLEEVLKKNYHVDNTAENDENCGKKRIDGIFASSDLIAAQVLQVCSKLGIRVPEDIKLVGFDDVNISSLTTPRITTIHQPIKEIAELTLELLINAQDGKTVAKRSLLPVSLVKREST